MRYLYFLIIGITTYCSLNASTIRINEVMPSNGWTIEDEYGESSDWFELYNYGSEAVNLKGWRVNDAANFDNAYILPDTTIQPGEYMIVWASGRGVSDVEVFEIKGCGAGNHLNADFYDQGSYSYTRISGDFTSTTQISNFNYQNEDANIIFMLREEENINSRWTGIGFDKNAIGYRYRVLSKNPLESGKWMNYYMLDPLVYEVDYPNTFAKITRKENVINIHLSKDNNFWYLIAVDTLSNLQNEISLGYFIKTGNNDRYASVNILSLSINDKPFLLNNLKSVDYHNGLKTAKRKIRSIHTDFKLNNTEVLCIYNNNGVLIDSLSWENSKGDISFNKTGSLINYFDIPTPSEKNSVSKQKILNKPEYGTASGFYSNDFFLEIISENDSDIYYTLDCSEPTTNSLKYTTPILINKTTTVRAFAYNQSFIQSEISTNSYIFENPPKNIHTIFINAPDSQLFSKENGILFEIRDNNGVVLETNSLKKLKAFGNVELINENGVVFNKQVGLRLRGGATRHFPQKSFNISTGSKYKSTDITTKIFNSKDINSFKELMLRNTGNDFNFGMIRDPLNSVMAYKFELNIDRQGYLPCRVYVNGEYYGILNLREKSNEDFIKSNYNYDEEDIFITHSNFTPSHNSSKDYFMLIESMMNADTKNDSIFTEIFSKIDIESMIDYYIFNIFIGNVDWPHHNNKLWYNKKVNSKWRHIMYDTDYSLGYGYFSNTYNPFLVLLNQDLLGTELYQYAALPFMKFSENMIHRNIFLNKFADYLNTSFKPENTLHILDSLTKNIKNEIPLHFNRWNEDGTTWDENTNYIRNVLQGRPEFIFNTLAETYQLPGLQKTIVNVYPEEAAEYDINSLNNLNGQFEGNYFADVPIQIKLKPKPGWKIKNWSDSKYGKNLEIVMNPVVGEINLTAYFEPSEPTKEIIVINEIMYKPSDDYDSGDWIEIYNPTYYSVDISGWKLKDDNYDHLFTFPDNTVVYADNYIVIVKDLKDFNKIYPNVNCIAGEFDFGFGSDDKVRLYKPTNEPFDNVDYKSESPWPTGADGTGNSIELLSYHLNNNDGRNWYTSPEHLGTPGRKNSVTVSVNHNSQNTLFAYYDKSNDAIIVSGSNDNLIKNIQVFDMMGNLLILENNTYKLNYIKISASSLQSGVYFIKSFTNNNQEFLKVNIVK